MKSFIFAILACGVVMAAEPTVSTAHGYTLSVKPMDGQAKIFMVEASGFDGEAMIHATSTSGEERMEFPLPLTDGKIAFGSAPATIGNSGGTFTLELEGERGTIAVTSNWGDHQG